MAEIRKEQEAETAPAVLPILLPDKRPTYTGKRSDPRYTQNGVFLKKEGIERATERLEQGATRQIFPT